MTVTSGPRHRLPAATDLDYVRTVDRTLLHRRALSEVFLTSAVRVDKHRFWAGAQLPPSHPYFTDHLVEGQVIDPLLLLECCRQAETYAAHVFHGVPADGKFILRSWSWRQLGRAPRLAGGPAELAIQVTAGNPQSRDGVLRGLDYDMDLWIGDAPVGSVRLSASYLPGALYGPVRAHGRGGSRPPLSDAAAPLHRGAAVAPHLVGRVRPENVVLAGVRADGEETVADLRVLAGHPSMFDHPLDHVPGMVAVEAARQLALLVANDRRGSVTRQVVTSLHGDFTRYIELDAPTTLHARRDADDPDTVRIAVRQPDGDAALIAIGLGDVRPAG
ncbi:ScbA/BarX family gamma-butyrolactone biosynthesis protein [Kitasatospora sp. NPDC088391]|uniref:ScbA/BarX family gamma-butyrolactone biosynthesis protein n=1 Tax=Kitasatospora sp. NPDC088391 TaxID=3364074 RepID=UPI003824276C